MKLEREIAKKNLRYQIRELVEKIMNPTTSDDERFILGELYEKRRLEFISLGGIFQEGLINGEWKLYEDAIRDMKSTHNLIKGDG